jgi:serine/threonine protein kinase
VTTQKPKLVDRYRIENVLGTGFGLVCLAHDEQLKRPVTAKLLHTNLIPRPEDAETYLGEVRTVANLNHPSIVPVYDFGHGEECIFVISKYVDGTDLRSYIIADRPAPVETARIIRTLAAALGVAHQSNLHHLNLRPRKILVDKERQPWIFARDFIREERFAGSDWVPGNPMYMSWEQVAAEKDVIGRGSDIFSLGVILYEMLTGRRPYRADGGIKLCEEIVNPKIIPREKSTPKFHTSSTASAFVP